MAKQIYRKIYIFSSIAALSAVPYLSLAQDIIPCEGTDCDLASLVTLVQNVINFMTFTLAFPVSALMFAIAGIMMFTARGKEDQIKKAKSIFWSVFIGLVIMLSAWLVVFTITNTLLDEDFRDDIPEELQLEQ